uniref:Uncharacterized protein n=1 Tax=Hyaloperonospora arabidopsidis (strain Emoy2) TaxID=559515 RepID=M4BPT7_HYAAE
MNQTALAVRTAKDVANVSKLASMNQTKFATSVRVQCAANFQTIANILRPVWTFLIALDASTCQGTSCVDIRVRFVWQSELFNLHVISVPFFGSHTGVAQSEMHCKLIGTVSDGAPNTTSAISGVIIRLHQDSLGGFYRVWYLLHQFDIRFK